MKKTLHFILDNDLFKLAILSYVASRVHGWMIFNILIYFNRQRLFHTLFTPINILSIILYALFGLLAAAIIKQRTRKRAFLSGLLLSLMLIFSPLEYSSLPSILADIKNNPHLLAPALIFFIMASFADYAFHKKDRAEMWDKRARVLTVGLFILFLVLLGNRVYQYYSVISSAAYKNSINADIPVPSGAQDVVHKINRRWGQQIVTFTFPTSDRSMEIFKYYDDYCLRNGFSRTEPFNPGWWDADRSEIGHRKPIPARWYLLVIWANDETETEAWLYILQMPDKTENLPLQKISFYMTPDPKKYKKWFQGAVKE